MKKGRPAMQVQVLCPPSLREAVTELLLAESTSIGVRHRELDREVLPRELVTVQTELGPVRVKVARQGSRIRNVQPEFEDCLELARRKQLPLKVVHSLVMQKALELGLIPA
jgi:uncharacterized protein (DUF111 family)